MKTPKQQHQEEKLRFSYQVVFFLSIAIVLIGLYYSAIPTHLLFVYLIVILVLVILIYLVVTNLFSPKKHIEDSREDEYWNGKI